MLEFLKKIRNATLLSSILTIIVGILFMFAPMTTADVIVMIGGWLIIALGVANIVTYIETTYKYGVSMSSMIGGLIKILIGAFVLARPDLIESLMAFVFAVYIVVDGVRSIESGIKLNANKVKGSLFYLIISIIITISGIVLLFNPFDSLVTMMLYIGIVLTVDGINSLINIITIQNKADAIKDTLYSDFKKFNNIIDVEAKDVDKK